MARVSLYWKQFPAFYIWFYPGNSSFASQATTCPCCRRWDHRRAAWPTLWTSSPILPSNKLYAVNQLIGTRSRDGDPLLILDTVSILSPYPPIRPAILRAKWGFLYLGLNGTSWLRLKIFFVIVSWISKKRWTQYPQLLNYCLLWLTIL